MEQKQQLAIQVDATSRMPKQKEYFGAFCLDVSTFCLFANVIGFSIKPLKVKLLAGEQKATESRSCPAAATHDIMFNVLLAAFRNSFSISSQAGNR